MVKAKSKVRKLSKKTTLSVFNESHIQGLLKDTLKKYSNSQRQIEETFKRYRPQIIKMTEQANIIADRFKEVSKKIDQSGILKEISKLKLDNQAKSLMEQLKLPAVLEKHYFQNIDLPPMSPPTIEQSSAPIAKKETILLTSAIKKLSKKVTNMEELLKEKVKKESTIFPEPIIKIPPKTHWEDIKIMFENKYDIKVYRRKSFIGEFSHEELGFICKNKKDRNPDKQWEFLRHLSIAYKGKESSRSTIDNLCYDLKISKDACLKRKSKLSKQLRDTFGIEEDPFLEYDPDKGYQTKFILEPETLLRSDRDPYLSGGEYIDDISADNAENDRY